MNHQSHLAAGVDVNQEVIFPPNLISEICDMSDLISYTHAVGSGFMCHFVINVPSVSDGS